MRTALLLILTLAACIPDSDEVVEAPEAPWPEWAFHHWVWENESTDQSATALVDGFLDHDIPVGAVIIDSPWATGYNTFDFDPARFPDPAAFIDGMHQREVRVLLWVVPGINVEVEELYTYGAERGYFMQANADSGPKVVSYWKGEASLIDFFNPEAVSWWHSLVDKALVFEPDGWKCDGLDYSAVLAPYSPGLGRSVGRLEYSHAYYRDFFDYTRAQLGEDRLITARPVDNYGADVGGDLAAFAPVDITWAGWVGDQDPDFGGLRAALNNMYHSSEYGYVAFGSDIGGFRTLDDNPLGREKVPFVRWAQVGALCPVMENGGAGEHRPWVFDEEAGEIYRTFAKLHHALLPYLMEEGGEAFAGGYSLMRFQSKDRYDWLLGDDLFVAPILSEEEEVQVVFPEGARWVWAFHPEQAFEGGNTASLAVPLGEFPLFWREGAAVSEVVLEALGS
ncbi:MAG: hypothetical protein JXX28_14175 [Deltaproteobacteria bacterium]|nr:hypothetical protein [Deltaproteobacteria bacterium]